MSGHEKPMYQDSVVDPEQHYHRHDMLEMLTPKAWHIDQFIYFVAGGPQSGIVAKEMRNPSLPADEKRDV